MAAVVARGESEGAGGNNGASCVFSNQSFSIRDRFILATVLTYIFILYLLPMHI